MTRFLFALICLTGPLLYTGCDSTPTPDPLVGTTWAFATQNPLEDQPLRRHMQLGDVLTVGSDSIFLAGFAYRSNQAIPRYDSLGGGDTMALAAKITTLTPDLINVDLYRRGQVFRNRYFTRVDTSETELDPRLLAGRTFRYRPAEGESIVVYYGDSKMPANKMVPGAYYVAFPSSWYEERSLLAPGGMRFRPGREFAPVALTGQFRTMGPAHFSHQFKRLYGTANKPVLRSYSGFREAYRIDDIELALIPGKIPEDLTTEEIADRLTGGSIRGAADYPVADSARVKYTQPERLDRIATREELDQMAFSFNPDGSLLVLAGEKLLRNGRWMLSPDRNHLILDPADPIRAAVLPIVKFGADTVAFRYPLEVMTRVPRGKQLPSYVSVNAYVEVSSR